MTRQYFLIFIIVIAICPVSIWAQDESPIKNITVIGTGMVSEKNIAKAKEIAVSNALASAIDTAVLEIIPSESRGSQFKIINEIIYDHADQFIQSYKVLAEWSTSKAVRVLLEAAVSVDVLKKRLPAAPVAQKKPKAMPSILMLISEQENETAVPKYWWGKDMPSVMTVSESTMSKILSAKGFHIADHETGISDINLKKAELSNSEAVDLGSRMKVDIVIIGKSQAYKTKIQKKETILDFNGAITLKAIRIDTKEEVASVVQNAVASHTDPAAGSKEALSAAASLAADELTSKVLQAWQEKPAKASSDMIKIIVSGSNFLSNLASFRKQLSEIPGVKEVQTAEMSMNQTTLMAAYQGSADDLALILISKTYDSFSINLGDISEKVLKIELTSKQ